jgi:uracil-DNA glycosylase
MDAIRDFLKNELRHGHQFFPSSDNIFRALKLVDYHDVKVVILGQDPYHGKGQANGLAFAVAQHMRNPPSLENIFKEVAACFALPKNHQFDSTLLPWAQQGVLCLNTVLTVRENLAFSHRDKGWEIFTDKVIEFLFQAPQPIVFLCWGSAAIQKVARIKNQTNPSVENKAIFTAPHPSPLSAYRGFLGCRHFVKANEFLKDHCVSEIQWLSP